MDFTLNRVLWRPPDPSLRVSVAIPVRNEATDLPRCLAALASQAEIRGNEYEVVLVLNGCTDLSLDTALACAEARPDLRLVVMQAVLPAAYSHVGWARRLAMNEACERLGPAGALVATTDADTAVADDWVAAMLREAEAGADVVAGDIIASAEGISPLEPALQKLIESDRRHNLLAATLEALLRPQPHDPAPRHRHQTGASLALRPSLYRRLGGLPPLRSREDVALVAAARQAGAAVRHSPLVTVETSARLDGRAAGGMAATLRSWNDLLNTKQPIGAESPASIERRLFVPDDEPELIDIHLAIDGLERRIRELSHRVSGTPYPADRFPCDVSPEVGTALQPAE